RFKGLASLMPSDLVTTAVERDLRRKVQELERELGEANRREAATAEVLGVISRSQTDVQPVFETIAANALNLCSATSSGVYIFDGELIHATALHSFSPEGVEAIRKAYPMPASRVGATGRAILTRSVTYIPDVREDPEYRLQGLAQAGN